MIRSTQHFSVEELSPTIELLHDALRATKGQRALNEQLKSWREAIDRPSSIDSSVRPNLWRMTL